MTIDEAIKRLDQERIPGAVHYTKEREAALKLGIEALKWRLYNERVVPNWASCPLPGETLKKE